METQEIETPTSKIEVKTSKQFAIDWRDVGKGLIVAALSPVIPILQQSISAGAFVFDWKVISGAALGGLLAYLLKNFFTPAQTVITETKK